MAELQERPEDDEGYIYGFFYEEPVDNDWQMAVAWLLAHQHIPPTEALKILHQNTPNKRWEELVRVLDMHGFDIHEEGGVGVRIFEPGGS